MIFLTVILVGCFAFLSRRWRNFSLLDIYSLFVALFLGVYTLIDLLVNRYKSFDFMTAVVVFSQILGCMAITYLLYFLLPPKMKRSLRLVSMVQSWSALKHSDLIKMTIFVLFNYVYGYLKFGITSYALADTLEKLAVSLPYWYKVIGMFADAAAMGVLFSIFAKHALQIHKDHRWLYLVLALSNLATLAMHGRRNLMYMLIFYLLIRYSVRRVNLFSWRKLGAWTGMLLLLVMFSNFYLAYRESWDSADQRASYSAEKVIDAATDFGKTFENFRVRMAMWRFNYLLVETRSEGVDPPMGELWLASFLNTIPAFLMPDKEYQSIDEMTAREYGLIATDFPGNDFASTFADFGWFSLLILPVCLVLVMFATAQLIGVFKRHRLMVLMLVTTVTSYLVRVENDYADGILLYRSLFVLVVSGMMYVLLVPGIRKAMPARRRRIHARLGSA